MKTIIYGALCLCLGISGTVAAREYSAEKPLKIGSIHTSVFSDVGWDRAHQKGFEAVKKAYGDRVDITSVPQVSEGADAERVIMKLIRSGSEMVFATSFGYMNAAYKVAKRYPKLTFEHATGYKSGRNLANYQGRVYEARYLSGYVAGSMTKTNQLGFVGAFAIPEVIRGINAFALGARAANPDAVVKVIWINKWYDPGKEREAAESLIQQGVDVLAQHTNSPAPIQAAEAAGVYAIGYHTDMSGYGSNAHLTAAVHKWDSYYVKRVGELLDGSWKTVDLWEGFAGDMVDLAPINSVVPSEISDRVLAMKQDIIDGSLHPFQGPVKNQAGTLVVAEGEIMEDKAIRHINWYVEGIDGVLQ